MKGVATRGWLLAVHRGQGQDEGEARAGTRRARHLDSASMGVYHCPDQAQAESKAAVCAAAFAAIQALPDFGDLFDCDAHASILDYQYYLALRLIGDAVDVASWRRILDGII